MNINHFLDVFLQVFGQRIILKEGFHERLKSRDLNHELLNGAVIFPIGLLSLKSGHIHRFAGDGCTLGLDCVFLGLLLDRGGVDPNFGGFNLGDLLSGGGFEEGLRVAAILGGALGLRLRHRVVDGRAAAGLHYDGGFQLVVVLSEAL